MTNEDIMGKLDGFILGDMKKAMDEITRLRAENETLRRDVKTAVMGDSAELADMKRENKKLREKLVNVLIDEEFDFDSLDDEQKRDITLKTLKLSYEDIFAAYEGSTNEEDKQFCQDMLDTLDKTIDIFSNLEEFEDWNNEKAEFAAIRESGE